MENHCDKICNSCITQDKILQQTCILKYTRFLISILFPEQLWCYTGYDIEAFMLIFVAAFYNDMPNISLNCTPNISNWADIH